jgi:hypothetical protein
MAHPSNFASCDLKLDWARGHADLIEREVIRWANGNPYLLLQQCNSDGSRYGSVVRVINPPPACRWSLIFGDLVHALRSSLDHFVYAAAVSVHPTLSPAQERSLQFPICDDPGKFGQSTQRISLLSPKAQNAIELVQPYNRRHPELPPLLALIRDFDNSDKHRLLNVVFSCQSKGNIAIDPSSGVRLTDAGYRSGPVEDGTEIAWATVSPPKLGLNFNCQAVLEIAVSHDPGPSGIPTTRLVPLCTVLIEQAKTIIDELIVNVK